MKPVSPRILQQLAEPAARSLIAAGLRGIEREALRVTTAGHIARTTHPQALGSALTHPHITTDYSEALLEFVTSPGLTVAQAWQQLRDIHAFVYSVLDDEILWATSMPCLFAGDTEIPIAHYGSSHVGTMKHVYRLGLAYRYGRAMQVISGVHFNYSVPVALWPVLKDIEGDRRSLREYIDARYFDLLRNLQRVGWLVFYLFGSSPAVCKSFFGGRPQSLSDFDDRTAFGRHATSLRMSDIGYHNPGQARLNISYNSLADYVTGLDKAINTPYPPYERIGTRQNDSYCQLSTSVLQIANEYYSFARPKQIALSGEKPTLALAKRGVAYIEVRGLDVDPYNPVGISESTMRFVECLLLYCLLCESPPADANERTTNQFNQSRSACCGRAPGVTLLRGDKEQELLAWAAEICEQLLPVAELLDGDETGGYVASVRAGLAAVADPGLTPSARILEDMRREGDSFFDFALRLSRAYHQTFRAAPPSSEVVKIFSEMAATSLTRQQDIEAADSGSFEEYLQNYFTQA